jgi:hypothetical protein
MGFPTIYPTATTVYDPDRCWNGYTVFQAKDVGATVIDMNGNIVRQIKRLHGFPNKLLPDGSLMGSTGRRNNKYGYQDEKALVQVNWQGEVSGASTSTSISKIPANLPSGWRASTMTTSGPATPWAISCRTCPHRWIAATPSSYAIRTCATLKSRTSRCWTTPSSR